MKNFTIKNKEQIKKQKLLQKIKLSVSYYEKKNLIK